LASLQAQDYQAVQQLKLDGWHDEQIDRGNLSGVIAQERRPALGRWTTMPDHVFGDRRLGDLDTQLQQLSMNARRTSERVLAAHLPHQVADVAWY
jgi:hypothetical protein